MTIWCQEPQRIWASAAAGPRDDHQPAFLGHTPRARRGRAKGRVKRSEVSERLQAMILRGELRSGSRLVQHELAAQFDVAQGVVREALLQLTRDGLVEAVERRGVFVASLDHNKLLEVLEVREMHEALAARRCCQRVTRAQVGQLMELTEQICQLGLAGDFHEMDCLDRELHARLIQLSGNTTLARLADNHRLLSTFVRDGRDAEVVRNEHLAILRAIQDGRADDAEWLARQHIAGARFLSGGADA